MEKTNKSKNIKIHFANGMVLIAVFTALVFSGGCFQEDSETERETGMEHPLVQEEEDFEEEIINLEGEEFVYVSVCSFESPYYCTTKQECTEAGLQWCDNVYSCMKECPTCGLDYPHLCTTSEACLNAGLKWCNEFRSCFDECPVCSKEMPFACQSKESCLSIGLKWCKNVNACLEVCPICSFETFFACNNREDCLKAGFQWCDELDYCEKEECPVCDETGLCFRYVDGKVEAFHN